MAKGKKRPAELPEYGTVMMKGVQYYRTRITDADGKRVAIYGLTREELYDRVKMPRRKSRKCFSQRESDRGGVLRKMVADAVWNGKN